MDRRQSTETDRRHLLADSIAPSETSSVFNYTDGERTPRKRSPARTTQRRRETVASPAPAPRPYKGFPSEADYLAALQQWAESKKYLEPATMLHGFYGERTLNEYASQPGLEIGLKKKWKARKEKKAEKQSERRNTVS